MGLAVELLGGRGTLLGVGGVALGHLVELRHRRADLLNPLRLLLGGRRDLGHQAVDGGHLSDDLVKRIPHLAAAHGATLAVGDRRLDLLGRLLGGSGGALGERANLVGDDSKPGPSLAGSRRLDGGVESEDVGLEGDLVDVLDDLCHLGTRSLDGMHGGVHVDHRLGPRLGGETGLVGEGLRLLGVVGGVANHHRHLFKSGARLSDARALLVASLGERLTGGRELAGGGGGLCRPFLERIGDRPQGTADGADDGPADQGADAGGSDQKGEDDPEARGDLARGELRFSLGELDVVVDVVVEALRHLLEGRIDLGAHQVLRLQFALLALRSDHAEGPVSGA